MIIFIPNLSTFTWVLSIFLNEKSYYIVTKEKTPSYNVYFNDSSHYCVSKKDFLEFMIPVPTSNFYSKHRLLRLLYKITQVISDYHNEIASNSGGGKGAHKKNGKICGVK